MLEQLFDQYKPLVYYCYRKLTKTKFILDYREDLIQEGFLALWKGLSSYKAELGVAVSTYLFPVINHAFYRYIKVNNPYFQYNINESLSTPLSFESDCGILEDIIVDPNSQPEEDIEECVKHILDIYEKYLKTSKKKSTRVDLKLCRARIILNLYVENGHVPMREIEENYYIGRGTVSVILKELRTAITLEREGKL